MAHARFKQRSCVNLADGGVSYVTIDSPDNDFTAATIVDTVQDTVHGLEWTPAIVRWAAGELRIRLTPKSPAPVAAPGAAILPPALPLPDSGSLTVTVSAPVKTVDSGTVDYVNDPP